MRPARTQFTIRGLMGVVAIAGVLIGGVLLWLRDTPPPAPPPPPRSGLIMEGVDINSNGAGRPQLTRPVREPDRSPRELRVPELLDGRPS